MDTTTSDAQAATYMAVTGVGLGLMMQVFVVAVQNVVPFRAIGSATALTQFTRSIGSTLGVTLMGVIINHGLPSGTAVEEARCAGSRRACARRSPRRCSRRSWPQPESRWSSS